MRKCRHEAGTGGRQEMAAADSEAFPHATLTTVPRGRTLLPLDDPGDVAREIMAAVRDAAPHKSRA
jgi:hypothetical protein